MKKKTKKTKPKKEKQHPDGFIAYIMWKARNKFGAEYEGGFNHKNLT